MSLNETPSSERLHIGFFGCRNAGKSSLVNAVTHQELSIVSDVKGTTTDPVLKSMELLPLGPVVIMDTPGLDDEGELGALRIGKAWRILNRTDIAVLVLDGTVGMTAEDEAILERIHRKRIPYVIAVNKCDGPQSGQIPTGEEILSVSATQCIHIKELINKIASLAPQADSSHGIVTGLVKPLDTVVLVVPIDKAAPKGRLILPQQMVLRELLDIGAVAVTVRDTELTAGLERLHERPQLVITDSQVFGSVHAMLPENVPLTSFSILMARYKGLLDMAVRGAAALSRLRENAMVLIAEGCTHHRQCNDIGTVKLPKWLQEYTGRTLQVEFTSGGSFPDDLSPYDLIIHCGGCMLNGREMTYRAQCAADQNVPMTNYGIAIAQMHGVLKRSLQPFPELAALLP